MPTALERELKQSRPFATRAAEALVSILRTAAIIEHETAEVLRPFGITPTQYNALRILRGAGSAGLCGREVAERLVARVPDAPRLLERLEVMGFIRRERDPEDRRHVTATITDKGLAVLAETTPVLDGFERTRLGRLSDRTLESLIEGLATIRERS